MRNILGLVFTLVAVVVITAVVQYWLSERRRLQDNRRRMADRITPRSEKDKGVRQIMDQLLQATGFSSEYDLVHNTRVFEEAVATLAARADEETLHRLHRLRQKIHANAMNPELELVSTRQLLSDLPVRLGTTVSGEKIDLYCTLLDVNEAHMLIDMPYDRELVNLVAGQPEIYLVYWREEEGETVFRVKLEPVENEQISLVRAAHVLTDPQAVKRSGFRLAIDMDVAFHFLSRTTAIGKIRGRAPDEGKVISGNAHLIDISLGGASFLTPDQLVRGGFAQISFDMRKHHVRLVLEVLECEPYKDGGFLARGRFRGQGRDVLGPLADILVNEQMRRLRDKDIIRFRPEV
ncbi:MAG: PilZ domain-containing protein [Deltaproteobacteria bacterium]|nr:PilZ domain-containing protein [Deltaproteobacteria bacterium]